MHDSPVESAQDEKLSRQLDGLLPALTSGAQLHRTAQRAVLASVGELEAAQTIVANVARICARRGYRTLLVDANLDEPVLHRMFGTDNQRGLSTLLSGTEAPNRLVHATRIPNLALIPSGPPTTHGSSLLSSEDVFHRVDPIARKFDVVIVDCSRLPSALTGAVAGGADSIIILAQRHRTPLSQLSNFVEVLRAKGTAQPAVLIVDS